MTAAEEVDVADARIERATNELLAFMADGSAKDGPWAHDVCALTREIHVGVWDWLPGAQVVEAVVIPAFITAQREVEAIPPTDDHPTDAYARNIRVRRMNLGNYVRGEESAVTPTDDRLEDPAPVV
jgi:hypothetical protein